jgi:hypothetical protein
MRAFRPSIPATLLLLGAVCTVRAADTVLVPGDPPLTQSVVDQDRASLEWSLNLKMSEPVRALHQRRLAADWKEWDRDARVSRLRGLESWSKLGRLGNLETTYRRMQGRAGVLQHLCWAPDPALYEALLALDLASGGAPTDPDRDRVLVPRTPLTNGTVDQLAGLVEWLFDLELTRTQAAALQGLLIDEARRGDREALEGSLTQARVWGRVARLNETDRRLLRAVVLPQYAAGLAGSSDKTDRWLFALYQSANPALTAGDSPLTRWHTDATAEMFCFHNNQVAGKQEWTADRAFKEEWGKREAAAYEKASAARKQSMLQEPLRWECLRAIWPTLAEADQQQLRGQWAAVYKPLNLKSPTATLDAARRKAEQAMLNAALEKLRHDSVMFSIGQIGTGGRTEYNPRTGRYEWRSYP